MPAEKIQVVLEWYHKPLYVALIAAVVSTTMTLLVTQVFLWLERNRVRREKEETLKVALRGEVKTIRTMLSGTVETAFKIYDSEGLHEPLTLTFPKVVFEANAGRLGELRDSILVGQISNLYALLYRVENTDKEDLEKILSLSAVVLKASVLANAILSEQTKLLDYSSWTGAKLSDEDQQEIGFCDRVLDQLGVRKNK